MTQTSPNNVDSEVDDLKSSKEIKWTDNLLSSDNEWEVYSQDEKHDFINNNRSDKNIKSDLRKTIFSKIDDLLEDDNENQIRLTSIDNSNREEEMFEGLFSLDKENEKVEEPEDIKIDEPLLQSDIKSAVQENLNSAILKETKIGELNELALKEKAQEGENLVFYEIFPVPIDIYWSKLLSNHAIYSDATFYTEESHKSIDLTKWEEVGGSSQGHSILKRNLSMKIKVKGVPFISSSLCILNYTVHKYPKKIKMDVEMITPNVPYGKKFSYNLRWVISTKDRFSDKTFAKCFVRVESKKKLLFRKRIEKRGKKDFSNLWKRWYQNLQIKNVFLLTKHDFDILNEINTSKKEPIER